MDKERLERIAEEIKHISDPWDIEYQDKDKAKKIFELLRQDKTRHPLLLEILIDGKSYGYTLSYTTKEIRG